jgi:hypothetical protein
MPHAARAQDSWTDPPRRPRRQAADWASPEDLEILGSIGKPREADWTVLTLERDDASQDAVVIEHPAAAGAPMARRPGRAPDPAFTREPAFAREPAGLSDLDVESDDEPDVAGHLQAVAAAPEPLDLPERAANGRRTVVIRGQVADRNRPYTSTAQRHRPARRPSERVGHRPDRVAMWAFGLGLLLVLVAILSAAGA